MKIMGTTSSAGRIPTKNRTRQPDMPCQKSAWPGRICVLSSEPMMLPQADSVWSEPKAIARNRPGTLSATRVVAAPNIPPTPRPTRKR